jgi:hypothetical protein
MVENGRARVEWRPLKGEVPPCDGEVELFNARVAKCKTEGRAVNAALRRCRTELAMLMAGERR